jgi:hypothetical protein
MAKADTKTSIDPDGLRYRSKTPGSPFTAAGAFGAATMSCFLCGKHRPRSHLKSRRLLGKAQFVCAPSCKEAEALANGGGTAPLATDASLVNGAGGTAIGDTKD